MKNGFTVGSMQKLAGKTAIVTGAGRGIGNAVARRFASEGARVILISRSPSSCGGAAEEINKEFPDSCKAYPCDVADYAAVQETMAAILKDFLQIDILVNNAGITRDSLMLRMKEEDWDAVLDTNLKSAFNTVKALQRVLMKSPAGRIINMSSSSVSSATSARPITPLPRRASSASPNHWPWNSLRAKSRATPLLPASSPRKCPMPFPTISRKKSSRKYL